MAEETSVTAIVGAITGSLGLAFSCYNYYLSHGLRIKVEPHITHRTGGHEGPDDPPKFMVRVVNYSSFPAELEAVSLHYKSGEFVRLGDDDDAPFPVTLAPKQARTWKLNLRAIVYSSEERFDYAMVTLSTGRTIKSSRLLRIKGKLLSEMKQYSVERM